MELLCAVQKYDWGKRGENSMVGLLSAANRSEFIVNNMYYAEMWMGVHPNGPSRFKESQEFLPDYIANHPEELGELLIDEFGPNLPFLFKLLSIEKPLSIQAHPARVHAEDLHITQPNIYKDPNHKPELAIALTEFEALCGFKPRADIVESIIAAPDLKDLLGETKVEEFIGGNTPIRDCFEALMSSPHDRVRDTVKKIVESRSHAPEVKLARRLNQFFPGDVGCLCVFWLNHLVLQPGEALFLAPNEPHAYISGNCIECMANSDNVVRAGLTNKYRDVETLCNMLTYKSYEPDEITFKPTRENQYSLFYKPPVKDFAVAKVDVPRQTTYTLIPRPTASIVFCTKGKGAGTTTVGHVQTKPGTILWLPANSTLTITPYSDQTLFQACCNL